MYRGWFWIAVSTQLLVAPSAQSQDCIDYESHLHVLPTIDPYRDVLRDVMGLDIDGPYLYLGGDNRDFVILDVSDPTDALFVAELRTPRDAADIDVSAGIAYLACGDSVLTVDVSDPFSPAILGSVGIPGGAVGLVVNDGLAYVADLENGLQVLDVSDPTQPSIVGSALASSYVEGIALSDDYDYVYLAASDSGLDVISVVDPANPVVVHNVPSAGYSWDVVVEGDFAFLAAHGELQIVDVSNPPNAFIVASVDIFAVGVAISGDFAYVVGGSWGLRVVDISDPMKPEALGHISTPNYTLEVAVADGFVYAPVVTYGILVADITHPHSPERASYIDTPGVARDVFTAGDFAYVADGLMGLQVVDVSDPEVPAIIGEASTGADVESVALEEDYAYLAANENGLQVVAIHDPANPVLVAELAEAGWVDDIAVAGQYVYAAAADSGLCVVDVSDPERPAVVGSVPILESGVGGYVQSIAVADRIVAIAVDDGGDPPLRLFDVSDPTNPVATGSISVGSGSFGGGVAISGHFAYLSMIYPGWLYVVDIDDPTAPQVVGSLELLPLQPDCIEVVGDYLLVGGWHAYLIDVSDPSAPRVAGSMNERPSAIHVADGAIYMALDFGPDDRGLVVYPDHCGILSGLPDSPQVDGAVQVSSLRSYPNPNSGTTTISFRAMEPLRGAAVQVFDVSGREVSRIDLGAVSTGEYSVDWGVHGQLPAGVYSYRVVHSVGESGAQRVVLLR